MKMILLNKISRANALLILILCSLACITEMVVAQQLGHSASERQNNVHERAERLSIDTNTNRQHLETYFSRSEIQSLNGISRELVNLFSADELAIILAHESRTLDVNSEDVADVLSRYEAHLSDLSEGTHSTGFYDNNTFVMLDESFYYGVGPVFVVEDLGSIDQVWEVNTRFEDYAASLIADSDAAGQQAGRVHTSLESLTFDLAQGQSHHLYLSHDYRHLGASSATVEFLNNEGEWEELISWNSNRRFANDFIKLPPDQLGPSFKIRFVYDDDDTWAWWWTIDRVAVIASNRVAVYDKQTLDFVLSDGDFERITNQLIGEVQVVSYDLDMEINSSNPFTVGYTILLIDGNSFSDPIVLQIGGEGMVDTDAEWIPWNSQDGQDPISGALMLDETINLEGLSVWAGHVGIGSATWSGNVIFEGRSPFSSYRSVFGKDTEGSNGLNVGFYTGEESAQLWAAEQFVLETAENLRAVSADFLAFSSVFNTGGDITGLRVKIYADDDGVPAGVPGGAVAPLLSLDADELDGHYDMYFTSSEYFTLFADIEAASGGTIAFEAGTYWLTVLPIIDRSLMPLSQNAFWAQGSAGDVPPVYFDPDDVFSTVPSNGEWVNINEVLTNFQGLALQIYSGSTLPDSFEIQKNTIADLTAEVEDSSGEVTIGWASPADRGYIEPFNNTPQNWEFTDDLWEIMDGYLLRNAEESSYQIGLAYQQFEYEDFFFETELRVEANSGASGFFFRSDAATNQSVIVNNGYVVIYFILNEVPLLGVFSMNNGAFNQLTGYQPSVNFNEDPYGSNIISVNAKGGLFDFYINGHYQFSVYDTDHTSGFLGLHGGLGTAFGVKSSHDYAAVIAEAQASQRSPRFAEVRQSEAVKNSSLLELAAYQVASPSRNSTAGRWLLNQGTTDFVQYEVYRDGVLVGTTTETQFVEQLPAGSYTYEVNAVYNYGESGLSESVTINVGPTSTPEDPTQLPTELALLQNYPNPFNPVTQIQYALPESGEVRIEVFNVNGQRVAVLANGQQAAGRHQVSFDG
ncbi:MAG: hypothetical protein LAT84_13170, partial [Balneolia bacterium]|nr:hypothetical protein [Balneolia bacterium]